MKSGADRLLKNIFNESATDLALKFVNSAKMLAVSQSKVGKLVTILGKLSLTVFLGPQFVE